MYLKSNIGQLMSIITNLRFNRHINVTVLRCPIIYNISYGWKNVTKCPSGREADMPVDFLTTEQTESYGRFTGEPDELQLARYFHLDEADKEFIGKSRGDHNRLGIALQIGCVRFLGTFLTDMNHIPSGVRHFTARQLGIRDIRCPRRRTCCRCICAIPCWAQPNGCRHWRTRAVPKRIELRYFCRQAHPQTPILPYCQQSVWI